jgi:hypothetical protein
MEEMRNGDKIVVGRSEVKRPDGKSRRTKDRSRNEKEHKERCCEGDFYSCSSGLVQLAGFFERGNESSGTIRGWEFTEQLSEY